jgi:hypothetical protein
MCVPPFVYGVAEAASAADPVEARHPIVAAGDRLAIDDAGARAQTGQGVHDQGEAVGEGWH